jgi:hypothetical protein
MLPAQACRPEPKRQVVQAGVELADGSPEPERCCVKFSRIWLAAW